MPTRCPGWRRQPWRRSSAASASRPSRRPASSTRATARPIALANREIGALPPAARNEAGRRDRAARKAINGALAERQAQLEAEHEARVLVEETVDVTLPCGPRPAAAPATR